MLLDLDAEHTRPPLALHDVDNAEGFVSAIVARSGLQLDHHDREDLCQYCLLVCWQLSLRFEPGGITFSTWAGVTIRKRINDWQRQRYGRTKWTFKDRVYERPRTELVSLDAGLDDTLASS
jgi:DNA-directed RNA polymerase specialized sigma24 family protein